MHERDDQPAQLLIGRQAALFDLVDELHQPIERILVTGKEDVLFVLEVIVEISFFHVQRVGDLLHCRAVIAEPAEGPGRTVEDVDARRGPQVRVRDAPRTGASPPARLLPGWRD